MSSLRRVRRRWSFWLRLGRWGRSEPLPLALAVRQNLESWRWRWTQLRGAGLPKPVSFRCYGDGRLSDMSDWPPLLIGGLVYGLVCGGLSAFLAGSKYRPQGTWFWVGFLFGVFGLIAAAGVPPLPGPKEKSFERPIEIPKYIDSGRLLVCCLVVGAMFAGWVLLFARLFFLETTNIE